MRERLNKKIANLEIQASELKKELNKLEIAESHKLTKSEVISYFKEFITGDINDESFKK